MQQFEPILVYIHHQLCACGFSTLYRRFYWTDWGFVAKIERASMDGTDRTVLHDTDLVWPNGLTLDYEAQILYWADGSLNKIESSGVDGTNRRLITQQGVFHPFAITMYENTLYWTNWGTDTVLARGLGPFENTTTLVSGLTTEPMGIQVITLERQREG